ncbi:MAG: BamA/TamA family outer membrane protein [Bryobacteraceae bacterium]|nr:BamA/TamA family outer membrane protein [Bryobacteraceae bacterium]
MIGWAVVCLMAAGPALAQTEGENGGTAGAVAPVPRTRAEEIEQQRLRRLAKLQPETTTSTESFLVKVRDQKLLERVFGGIGGLRVRFGGLATGSGFALGPEYLRRDLAGGELTFRASARASTRGWQLYDLELRAPNLLNNRMFANLYAVHRNFAGVNYFGPGPDSRRTGRSNFRLEDTNYSFATGFRPIRPLSLGVTGGYLQVNVGPGNDDRFVSSELIYTPQQAPGIDRQTDFLHGGILAQYDTRDNPGGPRRGTMGLFRWDHFKDTGWEAYSFRRLTAEVQQYVPLFNDRRVFALRAKTVLSYENTGQQVPFYLQPHLGGSDDLRGFQRFRFYDDNMLVLNAEYRWEVFAGLDAAVFGDAGKVFGSKSQFNLHNLESSVGFGLRFNVRNDVIVRIDTGFSREGFQVWFKFNNVF